MLPNQRSLSGFSREQKIGFIFMLIFAILTVGLGGLQLRNTIYGRFVVKKADTNPFASLTNNDEERLKNIDTDRDGLTDFEELQQFSQQFPQKKVAYLIWKDPMMCAGKGTFIDEMLQSMRLACGGLHNLATCAWWRPGPKAPALW